MKIRKWVTKLKRGAGDYKYKSTLSVLCGNFQSMSSIREGGS